MTQVGQWFGKPFGGVAKAEEAEAESKALFKSARTMSLVIGLCNLPLALIAGSSGFKVIMLALLLLWVPPVFVRLFGKESHV